MELKKYQQEALNSISVFCENYEKFAGNIDGAFSQTLIELQRPLEPYLRVKDSDTPYLCVRIPTGGGKTLLAAKSIKPVVNDLYQSENFLIIWLAPRDIIVNQTIEALQNPKHPYRQAIEEDFPNSSINVMSLEDAKRSSFNAKTELTILVGSAQAFNVGDNDIRKFYEENSCYHTLLQNTEYADEPSLANAIKYHQPYIIIDEAHKSRTDLSIANIIDLKPSFILELTATPHRDHQPKAGLYASNILFSVSASQLKAENMIKLPIVLETVDNWEKTILDCVERRERLHKLAIAEEVTNGKYIRPMVLFRAEPNKGSDPITYDKIKQYLLKIGAKENEIVISTGSIKELDNLEEKDCKSIVDKNCSVKYIITVDALKEGWDCPFAYILGVVSDLSSATAVEQLLGRILRNPYVEQKDNEELNYSYAIVSSNKFQDTANSLKDQLVKNGFEKIEADLNIVRDDNTHKEASEIGGLFGIDSLHEERSIEVSDFDIEKVSTKNRDCFNLNTDTNKITIFKTPTNPVSLKKELKKAINNQEEYENIEKVIDNIVNHKLQISKSEDFSIPKLTIKNEDGVFEVFEETHIKEYINWSEGEFLENAKLTLDEFSIDNTTKVETIDIDDKTKKIVVNPLKEKLNSFYQHQLIKTSITPQDIVKSIMSNYNSQDLSSLSSRSIQKFISYVVHDLVEKQDYTVEDLYIYRLKLKKAINKKINEINQDSLTTGFNTLFDNYDFEVSPNIQFTFNKEIYPASIDPRSGEFKKHYYPNRIHLLGKNEEYEFAKYIDGLDEVETWVRNIERRADYSFWLQTSKDKFYPDFILKLTNGTILVVEYKGEHLMSSDDTKEKEKVGNVWASLDDKVDFAMVGKKYKQVLTEKINQLLK
jgi:type III restriction enzyme